MDAESKEQYDEAGNASHYDSRINVLTQIERIWGTEAAMTFCEITEFKYRMRIGKKQGQSIKQEMIKANWYAEAAKMLYRKLIEQRYIDRPPQGNPMKNFLKKT